MSLQDVASHIFWGRRETIATPDGALLAANIHAPHGSNGKAVLMLHGLGGNRDEASGLFIKLASSLAMHGFISLRFDFRGCGESSGISRDINLEGQIEDSLTALDFLIANQPPLKLSDIAILGLSMGGLTAAGVLERRPELAAAILWEAPFDLAGTIRRLYGPLSLSKIRSRGYYRAGMIELDSKFFEVLEDFDPAKAVGDYTGPALMVQGGRDEVVPPDVVPLWHEAFAKTNLDIAILDEADHAFTQDRFAWPAIEKTVGWLEEELGTAETYDDLETRGN